MFILCLGSSKIILCEFVFVGLTKIMHLHIMSSFCLRLTSLDELDCSFNEIEALPTSIGQCVGIRTFAADHNFLTQLPPEVNLQIIFICSGVACQSVGSRL